MLTDGRTNSHSDYSAHLRVVQSWLARQNLKSVVMLLIKDLRIFIVEHAHKIVTWKAQGYLNQMMQPIQSTKTFDSYTLILKATVPSFIKLKFD